MSSFLNKIRPSKGEESEPQAPAATDDLEIQRAPETTAVDEKNPNGADAADGDLKPDLELPDAEAQRGVQKIEAVTLTWTKKSLAALLCL